LALLRKGGPTVRKYLVRCLESCEYEGKTFNEGETYTAFFPLEGQTYYIPEGAPYPHCVEGVRLWGADAAKFKFVEDLPKEPEPVQAEQQSAPRTLQFTFDGTEEEVDVALAELEKLIGKRVVKWGSSSTLRRVDSGQDSSTKPTSGPTG
jgi:hypothetical protein